MAPKARRIPTTSSAIVEIQPIATTNPTAHSALCHFGGLSGVVNVSNNRSATKPETKAYNIGIINESLSSTIRTINIERTEEYKYNEQWSTNTLYAR